MATDPTTPTYTPEQIAMAERLGVSVEQVAAASIKAKDAVSNLNVASSDTLDIFGRLGKYTNDVGQSLENIGNIAGADALKFGLFATAVAGASKHFESFSDIMDNSRLGSFTNQFQSLINTVKDSPTLDLASKPIQKLIGVIGSLGGTSKDMNIAMSEGATGLKKYATSLLTGADNSLRFQNALFVGAAQAGNLNELYRGVDKTFVGIGDHLGNLNQVTQEFQATMSRAMTATGTESVDDMGKFTVSLLQIPGGLEAMTKGMDVAGSHTDALTAIIQLADGAGLDINQTLGDIHKTTTQFGIGIDNSTKFVARFADVSQDLHAQQQDVRDALLQTSNAFKMFNMSGTDSAKMTQSLADTIKNYAFSLEQAGVPAQNALEIAKKYTTQFESLSEAQEAFISQQSGGPGGILGALKFEDMLRQDPAAASAKIAESLKKAMGGTILTKQEAEAKGDFGAEQYMKQRLMLTQGVLGIRASSKEEADAMIAAMKEGRALPKADADRVLKDTMDRGAEKERLAYTGLKEVNMTTESVRLQAGTLVLGGIQTAFSAGAGQVTDVGPGRNVIGQETLGKVQSNAMAAVPGSPTEQVGKQIGQTFKDIMPLLTSGARSISEQLSNKKPAGVTDEQMQARKRQIGSERALTPAAPATSAGDRIRIPTDRTDTRAGQQVGAAISPVRTSATPPTGTTAHPSPFGMTPGQPVPVSLASGTVLTVHITGLPQSDSGGMISAQAHLDSPTAATNSPKH